MKITASHKTQGEDISQKSTQLNGLKEKCYTQLHYRINKLKSCKYFFLNLKNMP